MSSAELWLFILTTLTSTLAGICAMGGGMILVLLLPLFVTPGAIVPVHAVTQLASNGSRLAFNLSATCWSLIPLYLLGSIVGVTVFSLFLVQLDTRLIPLFIACYLLLSLWSVRVDRLMSRFENFFIIGALQSGLGLLVGAPGPLAVTLLYKRLSDKNAVIATASLFMLIGNICKISVFVVIGFRFSEYASVLLSTVLGATLGSWLGTRLRAHIPAQLFFPLIKGLLTLMALWILFRSLYQYLN
ncbi:sulfite exporter TauE/SafE family protein [Lacimicrobium sp. SS2-24]|uniref:sulfite exporter TauE/SafE family protein n=1 Tax=Lacimicrobium sp. SS2-24 TaxID=2005569 RepID=UPI000B4AA9F3|nr:sulfite exporter TauE/SafE family protein [Lacimicrobium sp. SS2-24]